MQNESEDVEIKTSSTVGHEAKTWYNVNMEVTWYKWEWKQGDEHVLQGKDFGVEAIHLADQVGLEFLL